MINILYKNTKYLSTLKAKIRIVIASIGIGDKESNAGLQTKNKSEMT
jgi:hypothetical protein